MQEPYNIMKGSEIFRSLPEALVRELYRSAEIRIWKAGDVVRAERSADDEILFIVEGEVKSEILLCNADQTLNYITDRAGAFLGLYHFIEAGAHPWTMTAETEVHALVWRSEVWRQVLERDPAAAYQTALYIARQLYRQTIHLSTYLFDNVCWGLP